MTDASGAKGGGRLRVLRPLGGETRLVVGAEPLRESKRLPLAAEKNVVCEAIAGLGREIAPASDLRALVGLHRLTRPWRPHFVQTHIARAGGAGRRAAPAAVVPIVVHACRGHHPRGYLLARAIPETSDQSEAARRRALAGREHVLAHLSAGHPVRDGDALHRDQGAAKKAARAIP